MNMIEYVCMKHMFFELNIPVSIFREGKAYVAYTPVLDLSTCADTFAQVKERFAEAVRIFFDELNALGTAEEVLHNLGWKKTHNHWAPPLLVAQEDQKIMVKAAA